MTDIISRIAELERRLAAVERAVFGDDPQREAVLCRQDASQPDIGPVTKAVGTALGDQGGGPEAPERRELEPECATTPAGHGRRAVADIAGAVGLVADLPGTLTQEAVSSVTPDTPGGRFVANITGSVMSAAIGHPHLAPLLAHEVLEVMQMQADDQPQLEAG
jgi:hypothetical protein